MDLLQLSTILVKYVVGILLIGLVVFLHELGHFIAARSLGVDVEVLSFGMGPRVFSWYGRKTEYRISALPFGGYCRMKGSIDLAKALHDDKDSIDKLEAGSYFAASASTRFLIYFAGPFTNFLLAVLLLTIASALPVERISDKCIVTPISEYPTIFPSGIEQPGIEKGDLILELDGEAVLDYQDFARRLPSDGSAASVTVERNFEIVQETLEPTRNGDSFTFGIALMQKPVIALSDDDVLHDGDLIVAVDDKAVKCTLDVYALMGEQSVLTVERDGTFFETVLERTSPLPFAWKSDIVVRSDDVGLGTIRHGLFRAGEYFVTTIEALGALVTLNFDDARNIIVGPMKASYSIADISAKAFTASTDSGLRSLCYLLSIVSISLCVGNTLPIPTFDGGGMLISFAEMVKKRNLRPRTYIWLQMFGMVVAVLIIVWMYSLDAMALLSRL